MADAGDNLAKAKLAAATVGFKNAWCIQYTNGKHFIVSDTYGQMGSGRRWHVTDDEAIEMARKAGVLCDDDGEIL
jgi:hypothetical protein